jgi:hypothetical protein
LAHHHPLGVAEEHQHIVFAGRLPFALLIERGEVVGRDGCQLAQLALAQALSGLAQDRRVRVLKARGASSAASRRIPCECFSAGRLSCASAG